MAYRVAGVEPDRNLVLAEAEKNYGPNNFLRVMARRPEAMESFTRFYESLMGSGSVLDRRMKEMIYLAVSFVNECSYCATHHKKTAQKTGLNEDEIHEIEAENNQHFTGKEQAALHYARELTRTASVSEEARYSVQELFSDEEFVEMTMIVGLANFTNRFNNGLDVPLESDRSMG